MNPRDSQGQPITIERIYADMIAAGRYDIAAALVVALFHRRPA